MAHSLPRTALQRLSHNRLSAARRVRAPRPAIVAITRKVADIRAYPDLDKDDKQLERKKEKKYKRKEKEELKRKPHGLEETRGIGFGPVGSVNRARAEREARHAHTEDLYGPRELHRRLTMMLDGGKADILLHTLRARFLERSHRWESGEKVKFTEDIGFVYAKLVDEILLCDKLYYGEQAIQRIRDEEYDELVMHLIELERLWPHLIVPESPSQNVGHSAAVKSSNLGLQNELDDKFVTAMDCSTKTVDITERLFPQYRHKAKMLSLDNAYERDHLLSFAKRAEEAGTPLSVELKIDGVALSIEYRRGKLFKAATRGSGRIGDEVTDNIKASLVGRGLMEEIEHEDVPDLLIVRGEVYISPEDFKVINADRDRKLSNPRNAAAGALKHKDPLEAKKRMLQFVGYECLTGDLESIETIEMKEKAEEKGKAQVGIAYPVLHDTFANQTDLFEKLGEWGFGKMPKHAVCDSISEAEAYADAIENERDSLPFEIDGVVFKFHNSAARAAAGHTTRAPKGAIAYKFTAQSKVTKVDDVMMQVSRNGLITPVAVLSPVRVGGAVISRATLHNFDEIERLNIAIGDLVRVQRGGDVIPKIIGVEKQCSSDDRSPLQPPTVCPSCSGEIEVHVIEKMKAKLVRCKAGQKCHAQVLGRLTHFASKEALDIQGLGKKTCDRLVTSGIVVSLGDLYRITLDDILSLPGFAEKSSISLLDAIQKSASTTSLERVIYGLGFPGVGKTGARALALELESLDRLMQVAKDVDNKETFLAIPNFAEKSADALSEHLKMEVVQKEIKCILESVSPDRIVDEEDINIGQLDETSEIVGKSFVLTGKLAIMSRPALKSWIKKAGGFVKTDVSHRTDYVVAGLEPGQKYFKAQRLKVKVLQEEEFLELFKSCGHDVDGLRAEEKKEKSP